MSTIDYAARLTLVSAAITSLLTGGAQSVTMDDGTSVTKLDLKALQAEETRLSGLVRRSTRTRGAFRVAAPQ